MNALPRVRRLLVGLAVVLACGYVGLHYWREWAAERRLIEVSRVAVVELRAAYPPELVVDFENGGEVTIERTHFRLTIEAEGHEISRADVDVLHIRPGEKRRIVLQSRVSGPTRFHVSGPTPAQYALVVLPEWLRGLPAISGEFVLQP